jgi:hypothetical protein
MNDQAICFIGEAKIGKLFLIFNLFVYVGVGIIQPIFLLVVVRCE